MGSEPHAKSQKFRRFSNTGGDHKATKPEFYGRDFPTKLLVSILVFVFLRLQFYFVNYVIVSCELPYYNSFGQRMLLKN